MKALRTLNIKMAGMAIVATSLLFSCKKDNGIAPASAAQISFALKADNATLAVASTNSLAVNGVATNATAASVNWTEGTANFTKFQFEAKRGTTEMEVETKGLQTINLFALSPSFFPVKIDTGNYREIEIKLVLAKSSSAVPLQLKGNFVKTDGTSVPVELNVNEDMILKSEISNVIIDANTDLKTTFLLHLNKILSGISADQLNTATVTGGKIVISSTSNTNLFNTIKANAVNMGGHEIEGERHGHNGKDDGSGK